MKELTISASSLTWRLARSIFSRYAGKGSDMANTDTYSDAETERRANAALKRMLATPPKSHKDSKIGKRRESQSK